MILAIIKLEVVDAGGDEKQSFNFARPKVQASTVFYTLINQG